MEREYKITSESKKHVKSIMKRNKDLLKRLANM